ncbi:hypothetical protein C7K42_09645 [Tetragenococcus halophilus subsp. halophilus DSM 20339]|nr:hypothetical protein C7K42_09645 [Tetragenococcus halophilus subsp. halophilus DSM 20339]
MLFLYKKTFIYQGMNCIFELSSFSYLVDGGGESKKFGSTKIKNGFSKTIVFESFVIANTRVMMLNPMDLMIKKS